MEFARVTKEGAVAVVTLDRPPVNALNEDFAQELKAAFAECADPSIRAVVVTGSPHFAAGADIKGFQASFDAGAEERSTWTLQEAIAALEALEKPTIAAVHGYALGGGLELAMGADFRYLAEDARVGQPEILLGLIPGAGGTQRLPRIVGHQRAKELIYCGGEWSAEDAVSHGLIDQVTKTGDHETVIADLARSCAMIMRDAIASEKHVVSASLAKMQIDTGMAAGAVIGGWGTNAVMGTPWNPWDQEIHRTPGGSSSGSAVALAAGSGG